MYGGFQGVSSIVPHDAERDVRLSDTSNRSCFPVRVRTTHKKRQANIIIIIDASNLNALARNGFQFLSSNLKQNTSDCVYNFSLTSEPCKKKSYWFQKQKENCEYDNIPFNLKRNGIPFLYM